MMQKLRMNRGSISFYAFPWARDFWRDTWPLSANLVRESSLPYFAERG
jgi:hypothetical protein